MSRQLRALCALASVCIGPAVFGDVTLTVGNTEPNSNVIISNPSNAAFFRIPAKNGTPFAPRSGRGQTFALPDAPGAATQWNLNTLTLQKNANQTTSLNSTLSLTIFQFNPSNDGNVATNWLAGDGINDGDPLDGTGISVIPLAKTTIDIGGRAFTHGQYLHLSLGPNLLLDENKVYAYYLEFAGSFTLDVPSPPSSPQFQIASPNALASSFDLGMVIASETDSNINSVNADQDMSFYIQGTAVPEPGSAMMAVASIAVLALRRPRRTRS